MADVVLLVVTPPSTPIASIALCGCMTADTCGTWAVSQLGAVVQHHTVPYTGIDTTQNSTCSNTAETARYTRG